MKYLYIVALLFGSFTLAAQVQHGKITYLQSREIVLENHTDALTADDKQVQAMIAKMTASGAFNKTYFTSFGPDSFNCMEEDKDPAEMTTELPDGGQITIMAGSDTEPTHYYTNTAEGTVLNTDLIFDKSFLVTGKADQLDWTLTGEKVPPSEATASLDLLLATAITPEGDTITAGYAPSLPVQAGPLNFYGLPGAIITLEIPKGQEKIVFRATNIEISNEAVEIAEPTHGKAIGLDKFREQKAKKQAAMQRQMRG